jgi:hypothetical protein
MRYSIVITTIHLPRVLEALSDNLQRYSRKDEAEVLVIGDTKTPVETREYVAQFRRQGFHFEYWCVSAQRAWLRPFPDLAEIIPYNSDNRRNVGYLVAYERGRECIIALDDDNFPVVADYLGGHAKVGSLCKLSTVRSSSGWYNVCRLLETEEDYLVYPRGYPYCYRWLEDEEYEFFEDEGRVVVNAGLWLGDPDVDAVTRLSRPVSSVALKEEALMLAPSTNCPFNTQNTAFHRDILPCNYYVVMGEMIGGMKIDRYGDIWSSYFARKAVDRMEDRIAFGVPLTDHKRHSHDLLKDLGQEYWGMVLTNRLVGILSQIQLGADDYFGCCIELSRKLENLIKGQNDLSEDVRGYFGRVCSNMRIWVDVCKELGNGTGSSRSEAAESSWRNG